MPLFYMNGCQILGIQGIYANLWGRTNELFSLFVYWWCSADVLHVYNNNVMLLIKQSDSHHSMNDIAVMVIKTRGTTIMTIIFHTIKTESHVSFQISFFNEYFH